MTKRSRKNSKKLDEITIINPSDADGDDLFLMWFDQHAPLCLLVWAGSFEDAFEIAVDYLDEQDKPGYFTFITEDDYREAAEDLGIDWPANERIDSLSEREISKIEQKAEADITIIGHTRLGVMPDDAWQAGVMSDDWGGSEVTGDDKKMVRAVSLSIGTAETMETMRDWKKVASRKGEWHRAFEWDGPPCDATIYDQSRLYAEKGGEGRKVRAEVECEGTIVESKDLLSAEDAADWVDEVEQRLIEEREDDLDADEMAKA